MSDETRNDIRGIPVNEETLKRTLETRMHFYTTRAAQDPHNEGHWGYLRCLTDIANYYGIRLEEPHA